MQPKTTTTTNFGSILTYAATNPISWQLDLNRAARAHCTDRYFQSHDNLILHDRLTCASTAGGSPHNGSTSRATSNLQIATQQLLLHASANFIPQMDLRVEKSSGIFLFGLHPLLGLYNGHSTL